MYHPVFVVKYIKTTCAMVRTSYKLIVRGYFNHSHEEKEAELMRFFVDTANLEEIRMANDMGIISGVTTNPSLIAKEL